MIYKAWDSEIERFLLLPETGMGYQVIEAKRYGKPYKEKFIVYYSQVIVEYENTYELKKRIRAQSFSEILNEAIFLTLETSSVSLVPKSFLLERRTLSENKEKYKHRHSGGKGAKENQKENADGKEIFVRLSAFINDKRIDFNNKKLKAGSYTTTGADYKDCVNYSDDPIDRYALPNDDPIKLAFYIQPRSIDELQRGIVQPAFGHEGGGIEAYFENGTSDGTFLEAREYGK